MFGAEGSVSGYSGIIMVFFVMFFKCLGTGDSVLKFLQNQDYRNLPRNFSETFWNIRLELPLTAALGIAT